MRLECAITLPFLSLPAIVDTGVCVTDCPKSAPLKLQRSTVSDPQLHTVQAKAFHVLKPITGESSNGGTRAHVSTTPWLRLDDTIIICGTTTLSIYSTMCIIGTRTRT